ncbi:MAG TPA: hypothetical protein VHV08_17620, partial [Pirellulales bacterium]|nr:hypothetical protein [Pirellulales bacterium]
MAPHAAVEHDHRLSLVELDERLRATDPAAFLVPPRIVRRVIKQHAMVSGIGLRVGHRKTYVIPRADLLGIVDLSELDLTAEAQLPETVILLARPTAEFLNELRPDQVVVKFWRLLFHARVHLALDQLIAEGRFRDKELRSRILHIGRTEFEEIRAVLRQEDFLLPPRSDLSVYVEFVAVYLELRYFAPSLLRSYFPSLEDLLYIDELIKHDLDAEALLVATRLPGAPTLSWRGEAEGDRMHIAHWPHDAGSTPRPAPPSPRSDRRAAALVAKADRMRRIGNVVRAAILRTRAARCANPQTAHTAREEARRELARLARRLQVALNFTSNEGAEWSKSLAALLEHSARGIWTPEARMLYDLQKVCVDHERGIYTLDVIGWVMSLGRKSFKRFLPGQRDVLVSKHLRRAA